jgi:hypothetical protein
VIWAHTCRRKLYGNIFNAPGIEGIEQADKIQGFVKIFPLRLSGSYICGFAAVA